MNDLIEKLNETVQSFLPGKSVARIIDRGFRVKQIYEVVLDDNQTSLIYKVKTDPQMGDIWHEENVVRVFLKYGIPTPKVIHSDESCRIIPYPYLVQEKIGGKKLGDLLETEPHTEQLKIYKTIGKLYKKMHSVKNKRSGLWSREPRQPLYPIEPTDYMFNAELLNGSGKHALEKGIISKELYDKIIETWNKNLTELRQYEPAMIHVSSFYWNIYLQDREGAWDVCKLMSLGDVLWWDPAYDIATLKYPPFGEYKESHWEAFIQGYGETPSETRILLYAIMHRLCATMGVYMEPSKYRSELWVQRCSTEIQDYITQINQHQL